MKGGDNYGEPFSLTCPSRLYVEAGGSVLFSCSATAVPEEGIRYEWEPVSVGGLDFLSAPDELSPLFMAPSSGAGEKYAYRLTATALGVYETADVTVSVEGFSGDGARGEGSAGSGDCSSFAFEGYREGCSSKDEGSQPFGGFSGEEGGLGFPFPGSPGAPEEGLPGLLQAGDPAQQTAPYLDCPPAVFLQELEVGSIECHVSDALGEEFLEYMWEPVGSTTRDYLDNPRLIPEDAPNPSVVAPEAPVYETLESFRSGETTFRYRYRLTATSRATGLSSFSEVEVFVSSSRPSVYCPLEVVIEEGATIALDCEGVDPLSGRMDYDEDGASIEWEWSGLWGTSTTLLDGTDLSSPLFTAPRGSAGKEYHYIASMTSSSSGVPLTARRKVTVTVTGGAEGEQTVADASALASAAGPLGSLNCRGDRIFYVGDPDIQIGCTGLESKNPTWWWEDPRPEGYHAETRLSSQAIRYPTFDVLDSLPADVESKKFEYRIDARYSENGHTRLASENMKVFVFNRGDFGCTYLNKVDEGDDNIMLDCWFKDGPVDIVYYTYAWTTRGDTPNTDLLIAGTDGLTPTFAAPDEVDEDETYLYTLIASAEGFYPDSVYVKVNVRNYKDPLALACTPPAPVYEGSNDFDLACSVMGGRADSDYAYAWTARGSTSDTSLLTGGTDGLTPAFAVPDNVDADTDYEYTVTLSADGIDDLREDVTVTVKNKGALSVVCTDPDLVGYEGSEDLTFDCSASGAPAGSGYAYVWTAQGSTANTDLLIAGTDGPTPTFAVPDALDALTTYEYLLTVSAENAESDSAEVAVTVLNKGALAVACADPPSVYEGSADFALDCSASGAPAGSEYDYVWTGRGNTGNTDMLIAGTDGPTPTFAVPDEVDVTTTYEYLLTASAENAEDGSVEVTVTVLNHGALAVACADPPSVYEGSADFALDCSASGAPAGSEYDYVWTGRGNTGNTDMLIAGTDGPTPTFAVPDEVDVTTTYEYLLTASAENAEDGSVEVTVTVLNTGALAVVCTNPASVYEGSADFALDCSASGAPAGSEYDYVWTGRGNTGNTDMLIAGTDGPTPTFAVPDEVDVTTTYEYLLTASAENAEDGSAEVTVTVLNTGALAVVCTNPASVYEGSADFALDCTASGAPEGSTYDYAWTARGNTGNTDMLIAGTDGPTPTFAVPAEVDGTTTYEYRLTASAKNAESSAANVTVTVLNRGSLAVACADPGSVYEGSADVRFDCSASGAPAGSTYDYAWTARGSTGNTDLLIAGTDGPTPTFEVPAEVDGTTTYEYRLTASAKNAESSAANVTVTVLNRGSLAVACADPGSVYEGSADVRFDCSASGAPAGSSYAYAWTARGNTANTDMLIAGTDGPTPTFAVPSEVDGTTTYEYLLTVRAEHAESSAAAVTVTVLNQGALAVACTDPPSVYEGSEDIALDCTASGAPSGSDYSYAWTARGSTSDTSLLIAGTDGPTPTFAVPDEVDETTTYEYGLTVSAENAESGTAEVTVTVLNKGAIAVVCADPGSVYEGSEDIAFDCSASGAPSGSSYTYTWTARGATPDTALLSAVGIASPIFYVPDEVDGTTTYEYGLTVSAENAESGTAEVTVTVLNKGALAVVCTDPGSVYEGSADFALDCSASGAPSGSDYDYAWTARGSTSDTALLSSVDISSPTFYVPDEVAGTTTYEYLLTASAENAESATAEVTVTVLNRGVLAVACTDPPSVYEGSSDFALDCSASGAPAGSEYSYAWTARGSTSDTALLVADTDGPTPTFAVPDALDATTTYEYLLTVSATNAESASAEVTVTVLNRGVLAVACTNPDSVYEGSEDFALDCSASGAPAGSAYDYVWTARGSTANTALLVADTDGPTPTFAVPDALDATTTYEYLLTASADNAESATAEVTVTVLDRVSGPATDPSPPASIAESSSAREPSTPSALGVTASASSLRFGVQSADTQVSLDPLTDQISTHVSGPYHAGRMTLAPSGGEALDENGEMALSIELASPVVLRREGGIEDASIVLSPSWSLAESCEQLSSQTIGGLYTEVTLSEDACRLLRFGGELDLTDVPSGRYTGSMDLILRSGESEETHTVDVEVIVIPAQRVITIGPRGVRFSTSQELPAGLTEEQNLSIYPDVAFLTEEKPHGVFELSNPSLIPLEVSVSARFGYTEATENGREVVVEDASGSHLGDLSQVVDIRPGVLVLMPGEKGLVRYGLQEGALAAMAEKGYAAFFDVVSEPRQYVRSDQMPEEVAGERTARVTMRVPGVYVPGEGASQLRARLLSISYVGSLSATFLVETQDHPFVGEVLAYDGEGRELGRRETLVYTRSRVRIPLDRMPEEGTVFLRFAPRGSGRVPLPASVEWDAPRRDIGAAEAKDRTTIPETLVQRP